MPHTSVLQQNLDLEELKKATKNEAVEIKFFGIVKQCTKVD
jgi:hypothetical protein